MKKVKKILAAAAAAAITLTATGVAASASDTKYLFNISAEAVFKYSFGHAEMENLKDFPRYASATVEIRNRDTNSLIRRKTDNGIIGLNESKKIGFNEYSESACKSISIGTIHSAGSQNSPTDWSITKEL